MEMRWKEVMISFETWKETGYHILKMNNYVQWNKKTYVYYIMKLKKEFTNHISLLWYLTQTSSFPLSLYLSSTDILSSSINNDDISICILQDMISYCLSLLVYSPHPNIMDWTLVMMTSLVKKNDECMEKMLMVIITSHGNHQKEIMKWFLSFTINAQIKVKMTMNIIAIISIDDITILVWKIYMKHHQNGNDGNTNSHLQHIVQDILDLDALEALQNWMKMVHENIVLSIKKKDGNLFINTLHFMQLLCLCSPYNTILPLVYGRWFALHFGIFGNEHLEEESLGLPPCPSCTSPCTTNTSLIGSKRDFLFIGTLLGQEFHTQRKSIVKIHMSVLKKYASKYAECWRATMMAPYRVFTLNNTTNNGNDGQSTVTDIVAKWMNEYEGSGEDLLPSEIRQMYQFRRMYWKNTIVPALLDVEEKDEAIIVKQTRFICALFREKVLTACVFTGFLDRLENRLENMSSVKVVPQQKMKLLVAPNTQYKKVGKALESFVQVVDSWVDNCTDDGKRSSVAILLVHLKQEQVSFQKVSISDFFKAAMAVAQIVHGVREKQSILKKVLLVILCSWKSSSDALFPIEDIITECKRRVEESIFNGQIVWNWKQAHQCLQQQQVLSLLLLHYQNREVWEGWMVSLGDRIEDKSQWTAYLGYLLSSFVCMLLTFNKGNCQQLQLIFKTLTEWCYY